MFDADKNGSIHLLCELSAERISTFTINKAYNFYTFRFEPWIVEVFFKEFTLQFVKDHLEGKHPILEGENYQYVKDE